MGKGQTFLSQSEKTPSGLYKRHLRIIITEADQELNHVVVTVRTYKGRGIDTSCIIEAGEHPFIEHRSVVDFARTRVMSYTEIFNGINRGLLIRKEDVSPELLSRIQDAAKSSTRIPQNIKAMLNDC